MATIARELNTSPGIYTKEREIIYSANSLGVTGLGLVGETVIGPAFQPIQITKFTEYKKYFGGTSTEKYKNGYPRYELPYIAKSYLKESNNLQVTRVLGLSGFKYDGLWGLYCENSTPHVDNNTILATIRSKSYYLNEVGTLTPFVTGVTIESGVSITGVTT